ncbi:hypothetical protein BD289DRAFT_369928 [Coniella lustricola]|uniref:NAD(P)-binding protein n=1 Tax=Coniella lustricola TaxID=2025994 RepID=A0A2T3A5Z5_9PEZI|nr:hypothetical protein BD289DRAFT_369928 [Coniella lustricola]
MQIDISSASSAPAVIIFGNGSNIGAALVQGFLDAGYRVATVSRSKKSATPHPEVHHIQADLSYPKSIPRVFAEVDAAGYPFPSVLVWNAAAVTVPTDPENPFEVPEEAFARDADLMITSPYFASREAVRVWKEINESNKVEGGHERRGTFIMTGNLLARKTLPVPSLVGLGIGKSGAFSWISLADQVFREKGIRFFFADERKADGGPADAKPDAEGHAKIYLQLTTDNEIPSYVTFVDGKYREFS